MKAQSSKNNAIRRPALLAASLLFSTSLAVSGPSPFTPDSMETAAQIQWLLALDGCSLGPVDGVIKSPRGRSKTERCLGEREISSRMNPKRILSEMNRRISRSARKQYPLAVMVEALRGVGARTGARAVQPSLYDRTKAARDSLGKLAVSDSFPFLLLGMNDADADIAAWAEQRLRSDSAYRYLPDALWQIVLEQGEVTPGIVRFLRMLDPRERAKHSRALIGFYLQHRAAPETGAADGKGMLADLLRALWKPVLDRRDHGVHDLAVMAQVVLDAYRPDADTEPAQRLDRDAVEAIFNRFGDDIIRPLANVYAELAANDESAPDATLVREYLRDLGRPMRVLKEIVPVMDQDNQYTLGRLVVLIAAQYRD